MKNDVLRFTQKLREQGMWSYRSLLWEDVSLKPKRFRRSALAAVSNLQNCVVASSHKAVHLLYWWAACFALVTFRQVILGGWLLTPGLRGNANSALLGQSLLCVNLPQPWPPIPRWHLQMRRRVLICRYKTHLCVPVSPQKGVPETWGR